MDTRNESQVDPLRQEDTDASLLEKVENKTQAEVDEQIDQVLKQLADNDAPILDVMIKLGNLLGSLSQHEDKARLPEILKKFEGHARAAYQLSAQQKLAFEAFKSEWQDVELNRVTACELFIGDSSSVSNLAQFKKDTVLYVEDTTQKGKGTLTYVRNGVIVKSEATSFTDDEQVFLTQQAPGYVVKTTDTNNVIYDIFGKKIDGKLFVSDERNLAAKANLNKNTRRVIKNSVVVLDSIFKNGNVANALPTDTILLPEELHKKYRDEIQQYETPAQKARRYLGMFLGGVTAFAFGFIEGGTAILGLFYTGAIVLSPMAIPAILLALTVSLASTYANWKTFKGYVPKLLDAIAGKDEAFDGFTHYTKNGVRKSISWQRKLAMGLLSVLTIATGMAIGALGYFSTIYIPTLFGLGATAAAIFPPLGIALAALVAVTMAILFTKSVANLLFNESSWEKLKEPFKTVDNLLEERGASTTTKVIVFTLMGLAALVGLTGLGMTCYGCAQSVSTFCMNAFNAGPALAKNVGIAIGGVAAFISRMYFTFTGMVDSAVKICRDIFKGQYSLAEWTAGTQAEKGQLYVRMVQDELEYMVIDPKNATIQGKINSTDLAKILDPIDVTSLTPFSLDKLQPFLPKILEHTSALQHTHAKPEKLPLEKKVVKIASTIIDGLTAGVFFTWMWMVSGMHAITSVLAGSAAMMRTAGLDYKNIDDDDAADPFMKRKEELAVKRQDQTAQIYQQLGVNAQSASTAGSNAPTKHATAVTNDRKIATVPTVNPYAVLDQDDEINAAKPVPVIAPRRS